MYQIHGRFFRSWSTILSLLVFLALGGTPATAGDYANALKDVKGVKAVFDVSQGSARVANVVFWAVKNTYEDKTVQSLPEKPQVAVVFRGQAVKLLTRDSSSFPDDAKDDVDQFHEMIRQLKKDGVKLEVCLYAAKKADIDPAAFLPEIDGVGNGFISVVGYQAQGYSVVAIP